MAAQLLGRKKTSNPLLEEVKSLSKQQRQQQQAALAQPPQRASPQLSVTAESPSAAVVTTREALQ